MSNEPRVMSEGARLITLYSSLVALPAVVRERLVRLRHTVGLVSAADGRASVVERVEELVGEFRRHALAAAGAGGGDEPAHGERLLAVALDLHRHLVGGAADAAGLYFQDGGGVAQRLVEDLQRVPVQR